MKSKSLYLIKATNYDEDEDYALVEAKDERDAHWVFDRYNCWRGGFYYEHEVVIELDSPATRVDADLEAQKEELTRGYMGNTHPDGDYKVVLKARQGDNYLSYAIDFHWGEEVVTEWRYETIEHAFLAEDNLCGILTRTPAMPEYGDKIKGTIKGVKVECNAVDPYRVWEVSVIEPNGEVSMQTKLRAEAGNISLEEDGVTKIVYSYNKGEVPEEMQRQFFWYHKQTT